MTVVSRHGPAPVPGTDRAPVPGIAPGRPRRIAGLMSGTSLDGLDVAIVTFRRIAGDPAHPPHPGQVQHQVEAFRTHSWPDAMRDRIREATLRGTPATLCHLHGELGEAMARGLLETLEEVGLAPGALDAVASHGQTIWHSPPGPGRRGATMQLGCPATLAERTGTDVIADFRSRDMAAGGHGAPLVPWADHLLLHREGRSRALQNLGGMGNVTWLPADGERRQVRAFDTGPGVALLDECVRRATDGAESFDAEGRRAFRGQVDRTLLARLLEHPFLRRLPPRSTGREAFGPEFVDAVVDRVSPRTEADWNRLVATLTAFTIETVARSCRDHLPLSRTHEFVLTGGGARNPALVAGLRAALDPLPVCVGAESLGVDPDAREAVAFAALGWAHLEGWPAGLPRVTGARRACVLGHRTPGGARP